jgi:hypothetical protein
MKVIVNLSVLKLHGGVMRKLLLAGMAFIALGVAAHAADVPPLPTKAPQYRYAVPKPKLTPPGCTTNQCSVWFLGAGIYGAGGNMDIIGQGLSNSIFADGAAVGLDVGGQYWMNGIFLGAENILGYAFGPSSSVNAASANVTGGLDIAWFEAGGSLGDLFGSGATPVAVNNALISDLISPYFGTGPAVAFGGSSLGSKTFWTEGAGLRYLLPNVSWPILLDAKYVYGSNNSTTGLAANKNFQFAGISIIIPFGF